MTHFSRRSSRNEAQVWLSQAGIRTDLGLLIAVMAADLFFGDLDIGPASARIYLLAVAGILVAIRFVKGRENPINSPMALRMILAYAAFVAWAFLNTWIRGGEFGETVRDLGTTLVFSLILLVVAQAVLKQKKDVIVLVFALSAMAVMSGAVAAAQWLGWGWAWDLGRAIRPDEQFDYFNAVAGLSLFSVPLGYHLLMGGAFILTILLWFPIRSRILVAALVISLGVITIAGVSTLSRSVIFVGGLTIVAFVLAHLLFPPGRSRGTIDIRRRLLKSGGLVGVVIVVVAIALISTTDSPGYNWGAPPRQARFSLERLATFRDSGRFELFKYAIDSWRASPIIGDRPAYNDGFEARKKTNPDLPLPNAPHNILLNSLVFYGAIGTAIMLVFLVLLASLTVRTIRAVYSDSVLGPLAFGTGIAIGTFMLNAQFHNESFVSGSTLGIWSVSIMLAIHGLSRSGSVPESGH